MKGCGGEMAQATTGTNQYVSIDSTLASDSRPYISKKYKVGTYLRKKIAAHTAGESG